MKVYLKDGYRFQNCKDVCTQTKIYPKEDIVTDFIELYKNGEMIIKNNYAWDGPSGPCRIIGDILTFLSRYFKIFNTLKWWYLKKILPGSLFHDGGYQLIKEKLLSIYYREQVDKEFRRINIECKMWKPRTVWTYWGVRLCGKSSADPKNVKKITIVP
jgi:hypothetical protein